MRPGIDARVGQPMRDAEQQQPQEVCAAFSYFPTLQAKKKTIQEIKRFNRNLILPNGAIYGRIGRVVFCDCRLLYQLQRKGRQCYESVSFLSEGAAEEALKPGGATARVQSFEGGAIYYILLSTCGPAHTAQRGYRKDGC